MKIKHSLNIPTFAKIIKKEYSNDDFQFEKIDEGYFICLMYHCCCLTTIQFIMKECVKCLKSNQIAIDVYDNLEIHLQIFCLIFIKFE